MKGTLVEDINFLHRTEHMLDVLLPPQRRLSQSLQMLGAGDNDEGLKTFVNVDPIPANGENVVGSRKVLCPLLSALDTAEARASDGRARGFASNLPVFEHCSG